MVEIGQSFSIWCVRLAVVAFVVFSILRVRLPHAEDSRNGQKIWLRWSWLAATMFYLLHFVTAMGAFHQWSHVQAVQHTAQRTLETTGVYWGGGIYFNHLFTIICCVESIFWLIRPEVILRRKQWLNYLVYGYCLFITINAAIIFAAGPVRWLSLMALLIFIAFFWGRDKFSTNYG